MQEKCICWWDLSDALIIRAEVRCKAVGRSYSNIVPLLYQNTFNLLNGFFVKRNFRLHYSFKVECFNKLRVLVSKLYSEKNVSNFNIVDCGMKWDSLLKLFLSINNILQSLNRSIYAVAQTKRIIRVKIFCESKQGFHNFKITMQILYNFLPSNL